MRSPRAVSYTHLDVYKRQDYSIAVDYVPAGSRWQHAAVHFDPAPYGGTPASKPEFWAIAGTVAGAQHYIDNGAAAIVDERRIAGGHNMPDGIPEDPYCLLYTSRCV